VMVTEAVKLICGIGDPLLGRLMIFDALGMTWRTVKVRPDPRREPVTGLVDYEAFCGVVSPEAAQAAAGSTITAAELAGWLREREAGARRFALVDVREPGEREIVAIPGAVLLPVGRFRSGEALQELAALVPQPEPSTDGAGAGRGAGPPVRLVLHCKSGARSAEALALVKAAGYSDAVHVAGGVLAWVDQVDPALPTY